MNPMTEAQLLAIIADLAKTVERLTAAQAAKPAWGTGGGSYPTGYGTGGGGSGVSSIVRIVGGGGGGAGAAAQIPA